MPAEALAGLQGLAAVVHLALWASKAENAPKEVNRCLELVQLIYRDTQYLIELRNENLETLEQTPRELERINDIIITATRSIQDIGALLEKYRPEAHGGRTSLKSRIVWVIADSETFSLRAPNLMTQHSTILTEIQLLRNFQVMAPMFKVAGKAEQAEKERNFENVSLLRSLMGGNSRSLTDDIVTRKLTSGPLVDSGEATLSISDLAARPRTPTYDILGHVRPQAEVEAQSRLRHQPSLLSLFAPTPTPPPPYSQPAEPMTDFMTTSPSETGFSPPGHLREPYIMSATISNQGLTSHADLGQRGQRSQTMPSEFVGLKALFSGGSPTSHLASVRSSVYHQHRQSWDVPPVFSPTYTQSQPLKTADRCSLPAQLNPPSNNRPLTPMDHPFAQTSLANKVPGLSTKASNISMKCPAKGHEYVHELDAEPRKRQTLFELEGSMPSSSSPTRGHSLSMYPTDQEGDKPALVSAWSSIPITSMSKPATGRNDR